MGKPAARMGDLTAHGGTIVLGLPTVLIGGMPAARIGDMHVCPMVTSVVPHVGGPIILGSPMVLIGGMPAARVGDMVTCVGPPDTILMGCMTVLIGEGGSGSGSGGGALSSASASAHAGAKNALSNNTESSTKEEHWVEFEFLDKIGNPVSGVHYELSDTENKESKSVLRSDGKILRDGIKAGECKVTLVDFFGAKWSVEKVKTGDKVKLSVKSLGIKNGTKVTFTIFVKDINYSDHILAKIDDEINSDKCEIEWELKVDEELIKIVEQKEVSGRYSQPFFYFDAYCNDMVSKSGLLYYEDYAELTFKDENGNVIADKDYQVFLPSGEIKKGKLDGSGKAKIENIPPGKIKISFIP
jgi:uncharacterized Zn-binding protein involved in type VI secretion